MNFLIITLLAAILTETTFLTFFKNKNLRSTKRRIYIDTSALIDGRVLDIARTNVLNGADLIILGSVLRELQFLADGKDPERRARARFGLEVAAELEHIPEVNIRVVNDRKKNEHIKVDDQLLKLAKTRNGIVLTLDYNLIKVAEAEKVPTININDLSIALRTKFYLGEVVRLLITDKGANPGQGVGHLSNGTMVVVDDGASRLGTEVNVRLNKFHETSAGRLIFAKIVRDKTKSA